MKAPRFLCGQRGFSSLGTIIGTAALLIATIMIVEAQHAFSVQQTVEIELSRAANYAMTMSLRDDMRKDYISALDKDDAHDLFYDFLREEMSLDASFAAKDIDGRQIYRLEIEELRLIEIPPGIFVKAETEFSPLYLNSILGMKIRLPVRCASVNIDMR